MSRCSRRRDVVIAPGVVIAIYREIVRNKMGAAMDQTFDISGMHCSACVSRISTALRPFADDVSVTLDPPRAVLTGVKASATTSSLQAAVAHVGRYTLTAASPAPEGASPETVAVASVAETSESGFATYWPLFVIVGYIAVAALAGTPGPGETAVSAWMLNFMAGFFLVFSAFKFLNLSGFADSYASYDRLAKRWHAYGYVYPFLELVLGLAFLFRIMPTATNVATIVLMGFSSLGVLDAVRQKRAIPCACLGTVLKLPMSTITLVEDVGMVVMAGLMLSV